MDMLSGSDWWGLLKTNEEGKRRRGAIIGKPPRSAVPDKTTMACVAFGLRILLLST